MSETNMTDTLDQLAEVLRKFRDFDPRVVVACPSLRVVFAPLEKPRSPFQPPQVEYRYWMPRGQVIFVPPEYLRMMDIQNEAYFETMCYNRTRGMDGEGI